MAGGIKSEKGPEAVAPEVMLIPPGKYSAVCVGTVNRKIFNSMRCVATFEISDPGEYLGVRLDWYAVLYDEKTKRARAGSKYYAAWCRANGNRRPNRGDRMPHKIFRNKAFTVIVETANIKEDEFRRYSVVRDIVALEAGGN